MEEVELAIKDNKAVIFSKSYCPYCTSTKKTFADLNVDAKIIELDKVKNGIDLQKALLKLSGQRTVPNVYVGGKHLGGNDDTQSAAANGKLKEMLGI